MTSSRSTRLLRFPRAGSLRRGALLAGAFVALAALPRTRAARAGDDMPVPSRARDAEPPTKTTTPVVAEDFLARIRYLACDALCGRMSTEPGGFLASQYVASEFKRLGLQPVGDDGGYFQGFSIDQPKLADGNALALTRDGVTRTFAVERDWNPLGASPNASVEAEVAFAGFGVVDPERKYDDFEGLDAKGKIVVLIRREPPRGDGKGPSEHATFKSKLQQASKHGAVGVLVFNDSKSIKDGGPDNEDPILHWSETLGLVPGSALMPFAFVSRATAAALLAPLGQDPAALEASIVKADGGPKPQSGVVPGTRVRIASAFERKKEKNARNVAAMLPGRDAALSSEVVVVGAHHDHVGRGWFGSAGGAAAQGKIHPGADDNASGTAALLEMAEAFAGADTAPRRSILFLSFSGEELGLLGSAYYVEHPLLPLDKTVAMVNCDMVGRYDPARKLEIGGVGTGKGLKELVEKANAPYGLSLAWDPSGMAPSDSTSFYLKKLPVLFFFTGIHPDYHTPRDTWDRIDAADGAKVTTLCYDVVEALADDDARVEFVPAPKSEGDAAALNIMPAAGSDSGGVVVGAVQVGGAAEAAGIKPGDTVTAIDLLVVKDARDLFRALGQHKPGDEVVVKVLRDGKETTFKVKLGARKNRP